MNAPKTIVYFSFYLFLVAALLLFAPNLLFGVLGIPETNEPWIRVVGILVVCLAVYYHVMGKAGSELFAKTSVFVRVGVLLGFIVLWLAGIAPVQLVPFGIVDALAALWTWSALSKSEVKHS
jgi:hypothetical protein